MKIYPLAPLFAILIILVGAMLGMFRKEAKKLALLRDGDVAAARVVAQQVVARGNTVTTKSHTNCRRRVVLSFEKQTGTIPNRSLKTCRFPFFATAHSQTIVSPCAGLITDFETLNSDLRHLLRVTIVN